MIMISGRLQVSRIGGSTRRPILIFQTARTAYVNSPAA